MTSHRLQVQILERLLVATRTAVVVRPVVAPPEKPERSQPQEPEPSGERVKSEEPGPRERPGPSQELEKPESQAVLVESLERVQAVPRVPVACPRR